MDVNERIKKVVHELNMKQKEFAEKVGVSYSNVSNAVNGKVLPSYDTLFAICNSFHYLDARWLITGEGVMFVENSGNITNNNKSVIGSNNVIGTNNITKETEIEMATLKAENKALKNETNLKDEIISLLKRQFDQK